MAESLLIDAGPDRVVATLNRPEARNALDQEMIDRLHALCAALESSPKTLIITGSHGVFASGADISQLRDRTGDDARKGINSAAFRRIRELPMPVIAAVDGYALGGGAELAYAADIRIATPQAQFGNPETGLGIIAAAGATWRLPEIIGHARATDLLLSGRMITGEVALGWGLVSDLFPVSELLAQAHRIADRIAKNDARATQYTKRALLARAEERPLIELALQAELFDGAEKYQRMTDFLEKRRVR